MQTIDQILGALSAIRAPRTRSEYDLHALVADALAVRAIAYQHEARIAPRRRVDFLCGAVGIEIKRGKPVRALLLRQLAAYAESPLLQALVLVADRAPSLPGSILGKPLFSISLERLWGIAL